MPRLRLLLPSTRQAFTKIPNYLVDKLLPSLKDTEIRLIIILLRATTGFQNEGKPVTLPYHKLKKLLGRESEAISKAIDSLRSRGLIHKPSVTRRQALRNAKHKHRQTEEQQYKESK